MPAFFYKLFCLYGGFSGIYISMHIHVFIMPDQEFSSKISNIQEIQSGGLLPSCVCMCVRAHVCVCVCVWFSTHSKEE